MHLVENDTYIEFPPQQVAHNLAGEPYRIPVSEGLAWADEYDETAWRLVAFSAGYIHDSRRSDPIGDMAKTLERSVEMLKTAQEVRDLCGPRIMAANTN